MQFHSFSNLKQRANNEFTEKMNTPNLEATIVGMSGEDEQAAMQKILPRLHKQSNTDVLTSLLRAGRTGVMPGPYRKKIVGDNTRGRIAAFMEYEWYQTERPFYNVYPIVEKLIHNTKLNVSAAFLSLPYRTMLFRFAEGHEPYGMKSVLLTVGQPHNVPENANYFDADGRDIFGGSCGSALVQYIEPQKDTSTFEVFILGCQFEEVTDANKDVRPFEPTFTIGNQAKSTQLYEEECQKYQALQSPNGLNVEATQFVFSKNYGTTEILSADVGDPCRLRTIEETIRDQRDPLLFFGDRATLPVYMGYSSLDHNLFVFKLAALASMLHKGADLITPIVLAKHQDKYDAEINAEAKKWLEDKAAKIQGRGFSIGKKLQTQSEMSPHWRNPHMALYWTGTGRRDPKLILRAGAVVVPKHLSQVPTGFLGQENEDEDDDTVEVGKEYVYFLHEPASGYVKIGRTRRNVEERQRESKTFVPGGLKLIGYIVTGDCVELETRLHRENGHKRQDNEFFDLTIAEAHEIIVAFGGVIKTDE